MRKRVLFLCAGNSCRSQMAEAMVNAFLGEEWEAVSAGTEPTGFVHPLALLVLTELDSNLEGLRSKSVTEFKETNIDLVITVCGDTQDNCPIWLGQGQVHHIGFPDPAKTTGTETEQLKMFRQVQDSIRETVLPYLSDFDSAQ